ncbi:ATP synthase F1 subunit epsilon [Helicobacter sp. 23-1045]
MEHIKLSIVTPYGEIFSDEVKSVFLPGSEGEFGVLPGHCDFLSLLKVGVIDILKKDDKRELVAINWGYAEVTDSKVAVLANGAVAIEGSSDSEISDAIDNAKNLLKSAAAEEALVSIAITKIENNSR